MRELVHQLVIQFPESAFPDFLDLVKYEDALIDALGDAHEVDGHDIGSGEVNFFVFTDDPTVALGLKRMMRNAASYMSPSCSGRSGIAPGLWAAPSMPGWFPGCW